MSNRYWIWMAAVAVVAALAGAYVARTLNAPAVPSLEAGTSLPEPRVLPDFNLVDTHGAATTLAGLRGHPTLVFFGFTHCPDVCPTTLAQLASVQKQAAIPSLKVALISVDPERDTPEQLGAYVGSFGGDFIGLTGSAPEILKATKGFGVAAARVDLPGGNYTMDHSAAVFALDSQARIVAIFTPPLSVPALTRDMERLRPLLNVSS
ncbi:MAG TPA: SCO family protein [Steroidobacteraceae bacterium]|jgi:protein SCO1/2|nr:SCO family protein [Steroidobacteraceae bacterium]